MDAIRIVWSINLLLKQLMSNATSCVHFKGTYANNCKSVSSSLFSQFEVTSSITLRIVQSVLFGQSVLFHLLVIEDTAILTSNVLLLL